MNQHRKPERLFKKKNIKSMIIWYLILLVGILISAWKMADIITLFRY